MNEPLRSYKDLRVWQLSRELVADVYRVCGLLPKNEMFGLASQLKRAVISIPSNTAEGYRRNNRGEYVQFLGIAAGSAAEVETQLILAQDLFGVEARKELAKVNDVQKMLESLIRKLRS